MICTKFQVYKHEKCTLYSSTISKEGKWLRSRLDAAGRVRPWSVCCSLSPGSTMWCFWCMFLLVIFVACCFSALLVTDRRSFQYPKIALGKHEIKWKKSIKYLGVQLDRRLSFGKHLQIATAKAIQCGAALTRLMPNIGGPREVKRRLVAIVVNS